MAVTDLQGIYTYHNDLARSGANTQEYALTPSNVNANSFGKLFSCTVDGAIFAQPLWVANLTIGNAEHNVVFVATEHDSVFAFDADHSPCEQLWSVSLNDSAHGANSGERAVLSAGSSALVSSASIVPEVGVTGTPVIDPRSETLYVVSKSVDSAGATFYQRIHAIDLTTGAEKPGSPATIAATYPGNGDGGNTVTFNPKTEFQRAGLALSNNTIYIAWASHGDTPPYYGWLVAYSYDGKSFSQTYALNVTPNVGYGGIWMTGAAPAVDEAGNLYILTGNGTFDANNAGPLVSNDYGDSLLQISNTLTVSQYFTPSDQDLGMPQDLDLGTSGAVLIDPPAGAGVTHLVVGGGKDGILRSLNRDSLGGYGDDFMWQQISVGGPLYTPAYWNNTLYVSTGVINSYVLNSSTAQFGAGQSASLITSGFLSASTSISARNDTNGIVWAIAAAPGCFITASTSRTGAPAVLAAYDATNLQNELWTSSSDAADTAGQGVGFALPTVANGKVYVGTHGNGDAACSLTANTGELDVYGLK